MTSDIKTISSVQHTYDSSRDIPYTMRMNVCIKSIIYSSILKYTDAKLQIVRLNPEKKDDVNMEGKVYLKIE